MVIISYIYCSTILCILVKNNKEKPLKKLSSKTINVIV